MGAAPTPRGQVTRQAHLLFVWGLHSNEEESEKEVDTTLQFVMKTMKKMNSVL